jgi:hypothetical protein
MGQPLIPASNTTEDVLATLTDVTLIYDAALGSPPETQPLGGKVVAVPRAAIPLPKRGQLYGQQGFGRQQVVSDPLNPGGTMVRWEWVMTGGTDQIDAFVDSLTGRGSWVNAGSRATVKLMVQRLFSAGISRNTIVTQIPQFYGAVAAEVVAEQASP